MKPKNKDKGIELLDVDENGNPEEKKEEKKEKSSGISKYIIIIILLILLLCFNFFFFSSTKNKRTAFDSTKLKKLNLKNRLFYGAEFDQSFVDGKFTDKAIKKIESLAERDFSFMITGGSIISEIKSGLVMGKELPRLDKDVYIEEHKKLVEAAHKNNLYIIAQIANLGLLSEEEIIYSPSVNKAFFVDRYSVEMTKEDILRLENAYYDAAIRVKKAGYDGIQIPACHFGLPELFLSRTFNRRTDEYGGSFENRARFIIEIIKKVKEAVGDSILLSVKIDSEGKDDTVDPEEFYLLGKMLEEAGVDIIEVSGNNKMEIKSDDIFYYNAAKKLAEMVKIPVAVIGGVKRLEQIDFALKDSKIEYFGIVRASMKDPLLIKKWKVNNNNK